MIRTGENGSTLEVIEPEHKIIGRYFARVKKAGDAGDLVIVKGVTEPVGVPVEEEGGTLWNNLLVVACAEFGAVPPGWRSHVESFDVDAFQEEYFRTGPPSASIAAAQSAADTAERDAARLRMEAEHLAAVQTLADKIKKERR